MLELGRASARPKVLLAVAAVGAAASTSALSASGGEARRAPPVIVVSPAKALIDDRVDVRVTGLPPRRKVALTATTRDRLGVGWRSRLVFTASRRGVVDTRSNTKLFWSMRPSNPSSATATFALSHGDMTVLVRASLGGHTVASAVLVRRTETANLTAKDTTLADEGFVGTYYASEPAGLRRRCSSSAAR